MKIAGVVVLYNPDDNVRTNIDSYINELDILYVVDNSPIPNDNNKKINCEKIKYISNNGNKGIANALNVGANNALKENCEWLLTMDQDSTFKDNSLSKMKELLKKLNKVNNELIKRYSKNALNRYNTGSLVHEKQILFHKCQKRNRWVFGGNRSGKTECGAVEAIWLARGIHPFRKNRKRI